MNPEKKRPDFTARACASTYAVMVGVWVLPLFVVSYSALRHAKGAWSLIAVLGCVLVLSLLWVGLFQITIDGNTIYYRSLLGGVRKLALDKVEKAEIKFDRTARFGPFYKLILWPEPLAHEAPTVINMKVFGKADLHRVFDFLGPKLKSERRFTLTRTEREELRRNIP